MMHMTFYWGKKVTLLFDFWKTESLLGYLLTLLACFIVAAFYQYMEDRRLRFKSLASVRPNPPPPTSAASAPLIPKFSASDPRSASWFASALLFGVNAAIGYMLMLAVMSFNGGVLVAVVLGLTVGYLVFRSADEGANAENPCACA